MHYFVCSVCVCMYELYDHLCVRTMQNRYIIMNSTTVNGITTYIVCAFEHFSKGANHRINVLFFFGLEVALRKFATKTRNFRSDLPHAWCTNAFFFHFCETKATVCINAAQKIVWMLFIGGCPVGLFSLSLSISHLSIRSDFRYCFSIFIIILWRFFFCVRTLNIFIDIFSANKRAGLRACRAALALSLYTHAHEHVHPKMRIIILINTCRFQI